MKRSAVLGICVLLAVLAGGLLFWKTKHPKSAAVAPGAGAGAAAARAPAAKRANTAPAEPPADLALRHDEDPKGPMRLEGQVVDADEQPVGGALVAIDANPPREVKSEADGSFSFDGLLQRGYQVEAHKDDLHAGPANVNVRAKTEPVTLRLQPGGALDVTALDADSKKPVAGARVEARAIGSLSAVAGADGVAHLRGLRGGILELKVQANGYAPAFEAADVPREPGASSQQTVLLHRGSPVAGLVVDDAGKPVAGARVMPVSGSSFIELGTPRLDGALSDAKGKWKIAAVAPGSWRFEATDDHHAPGQSNTVMLMAGGIMAGEVLIKMPAAASLDGEVHSAAGKPVGFATVRVSTPAGAFAPGRPRVASCDEHGHFHIDGLPRRQALVLAAHESGSSDVVTLDLATAPEQKNLVLVLSQDGAISGTVVTPAGQPVAEARVIALPELGEGADSDSMTRWTLLGSVSDVADQAGAFRLSGLPKGKYRLRASRAEASIQDPATWQRKGEAASTGDVGVRLTLEDDAVVKGKVAFKDGSAPDSFTVTTSAWGAPAPFATKDGSFRLEHVAAGQRMLTVSGSGFTRKTTDPFEAKPGVETDVGTITVERGRVVRGRVTRPDGTPAAGASVYAGNRFIGTGDSIKGPGGIPGRLGKETTADEQGNFELTGVGVRQVLVVAESEDGRSITLPVPPGEADVTLTVPLAPTGAVEGRVTEASMPVPSAAVVAQAQSSFRGQFIVKAGEDGSFRFDKLSPDSYLVSAVRQQSIGSVDMSTQVVRVESGQVAHVELELVKTDLTLSVAVQGADGQPVKSALVFMLEGAASARTAIEIEQALAAKGPGHFAQGAVLGGTPQRFTNVRPGNYSVCVLPLAGDIRDSSQAEGALRDPDALPVSCKPVVIASAPNDQSVTIPVAPAAPPPPAPPKPPAHKLATLR